MIRPATVDDALAIGQVHVESWRSTYRGLMPDAVLDNLSVERRADFWQRVLAQDKSQSAFVAVDAQENIVGFVNGGLERERDPVYSAELYALYLLKKQQGHGYGKALMLALVERFINRVTLPCCSGYFQPTLRADFTKKWVGTTSTPNRLTSAVRR